MALLVFGLVTLKVIPLVHTRSSTDPGCDFSTEPVVVTRSYEGSDKEKELKVVPVVINNNNVNIVSASKEDFEDNDVTFLMKILTIHSKAPSKPLSMQKWYGL